MKINNFFKNDYSDELNWRRIEAIPVFDALKGCKQNAHWHKEGDVWAHTVNSVKELLGFQQQHIGCDRLLIVATLCHDLGKAPTAKLDESTGEWSSPNHAAVGERMVRELLSDENPLIREHICEIVRHHMKLHYVMDKPTDEERKIAIYNLLAELKFSNFDEMWLLNAADDFGSENDQTWEERHTRLRAISRLYGDVLQEAAEKAQKEPAPIVDTKTIPMCVVMIGLPGSGKSSLVEKCYADMVCLSRDKIRAELGLCKEGEKIVGTPEQEEKVTKIFDTRFRDCVRHSRNVVIDNTNLRREHRMKNIHKVLEEMGAKYLIHYHVVDTPVDICCKRREGEIDKSVIERMRKGYDFPSAIECNNIMYSSGKGNEWPFMLYTDFQKYWKPKTLAASAPAKSPNPTRVFMFGDMAILGTLVVTNGKDCLYKLDRETLDGIGFDGVDEQEIKEKFPELCLPIGEYLGSCFVIVNDVDGEQKASHTLV